jgi:hypothetical protein
MEASSVPLQGKVSSDHILEILKGRSCISGISFLEAQNHHSSSYATMRVRILASVPLSFKAAMVSELKVICSFIMHNKFHQSRPQDNQKEEELMPYFMLSKISFSRYEEGVASLISHGPDNGCRSL